VRIYATLHQDFFCVSNQGANMNAAMLSPDVGPSTGSFSPDPYTVAEHMPISKAMVEQVCTPSERHEMIARAAYYRSQRRGFAPGLELDDWLAAEHDINAVCGLIEPHPSWDLPNRT
jgi:hypothetical protein